MTADPVLKHIVDSVAGKVASSLHFFPLLSHRRVSAISYSGWEYPLVTSSKISPGDKSCICAFLPTRPFL